MTDLLTQSTGPPRDRYGRYLAVAVDRVVTAVLVVLAVWCVVSVPVAVLAGRFMAVGGRR